MEDRIYLSAPHMSGKEQKYIQEAFDSNWIAPLGPNVDAFEQELASYVGIKGVAALSSGTAAIHLALRLVGVGQGDTVFCSTLTFAASCNPILYLGGTPVFIDSEPETWNMSPSALSNAFEAAEKEGKLPKAIIIVNLYGQSADMDNLLPLCDKYNVPVIEDAAESLGATYKHKASGTFGRYGIYSFNGNKIITTSGGGVLVSNDLVGLEKARFWATQSREPAKHYQHSELGYNYRMSNVLAGIGRAQLQVLNDRITAKREIFSRYEQAMANIPGISFMPEASNGHSTRWLTVMTVNPEFIRVTPAEICDYLAEHNIEARPVWKPMHLQPLYQGAKYYMHDNKISIADKIFNTGICLPSGTSMSVTEQEQVITYIKEIINR